MRCVVCGLTVGAFVLKELISDKLSEKWRLTKDQRRLFNKRESSFCPKCRSSARDRILAKALLKTFPTNDKTLINWVKNCENLAIAEINACGSLHRILKNIENLSYSEYKTDNIYRFTVDRIINRARSEDIQYLSYPDNSFDLVIHSETLEHVPDPRKALDECRRILKLNGK